MWLSPAASGMNRFARLLIATALLLLGGLGCLADALDDLPAPFQNQLIAIEPIDLGGAEPLMRDAIIAARAEVAERLTETAPDPKALAAAYGRLGAQLLLLEIEAPADACFRNAHALDPDTFRWPYYAGYLAMMAGRTDAALGYFERARAIDATYRPLSLRLGKIYLDRSELARARGYLEPLAGDPGLAAASNYYLGQIANLQRRHREAIAYLENALAANPDASEVHYPLALAYRALGNNDQARAHLERFEPREPTADDPLLAALEENTQRSLPHFQRGLRATRQGDYATAIEDFAAGLAIDPGNNDARVSYARVLFLAGDDRAAGELEDVLERDPHQVLATFLSGVLAQAAGRFEDAIAAYEKAIALDPGHAGANFYLANIAYAIRDYEAAARGYAVASAADPENFPAHALGAIARVRAGESEDSVAHELDRHVADNPGDVLSSYVLARLLAGATDEAARRPRRALALAQRLSEQPIPPHLRALALAQAASGQFDAAILTQGDVLALLSWGTPIGEQAIAEAELASYRAGELPPDYWPPADPLLGPPPFDPIAVFRDYPAVAPY